MVYVDYPGQLSLTQIYGTFNRAMLRLVPSLKPYAEPLTNAMVEFYLMSQVKELYSFRYLLKSWTYARKPFISAIGKTMHIILKPLYLHS